MEPPAPVVDPAPRRRARRRHAGTAVAVVAGVALLAGGAWLALPLIDQEARTGPYAAAGEEAAAAPVAPFGDATPPADLAAWQPWEAPGGHLRLRLPPGSQPVPEPGLADAVSQDGMVGEAWAVSSPRVVLMARMGLPPEVMEDAGPGLEEIAHDEMARELAGPESTVTPVLVNGVRATKIVSTDAAEPLAGLAVLTGDELWMVMVVGPDPVAAEAQLAELAHTISVVP